MTVKHVFGDSAGAILEKAILDAQKARAQGGMISVDIIDEALAAQHRVWVAQNAAASLSPDGRREAMAQALQAVAARLK